MITHYDTLNRLTIVLVIAAVLILSTHADKQNHTSYHGSPPLPVCIGQNVTNGAAVIKCLPTITPCPGEGSTSCCQHNGYDYYCCPKLAGSTCPSYANATAWVKTWEPVYTYDHGLFYRQVFHPVGANTSSAANSTTAKPNTNRLKKSKNKTEPKESKSKDDSAAKTAANAKKAKRTKVASKLTVSEGKKIVEKSRTRRPKKVTTKKPTATKMKKSASKSNSEKVDDEEKSADENSTISTNESSEEKSLDSKTEKVDNKNSANNPTTVQNNKNTGTDLDKKSSQKSERKQSDKNGSEKSSQSEEDLKIFVGEIAAADPRRIANLINHRQSSVIAPSINSPIIALSANAPIITLEQINGDLNAAFLTTAQPELEIATTAVEFSTAVDASTVDTTANSDISTVDETTVDSTTVGTTLTMLKITEDITLEMLEPTEPTAKKDNNDPLEAKFLEDKFQKNSPPATFSPALRQLLLSHRNVLQQATATEKEQIKLSKPAMFPLGFNLDSDAPMTIHFNQSAISSSSRDSHDVTKPTNQHLVPKSDSQSNISDVEDKNREDESESESEEKSSPNENSKDLRGWYIKTGNMSSNPATETNQPIRLKMANWNRPIKVTSEILHGIDKKPSGNSLLTPTIRAALLRIRQMQKQTKGNDILRSR